MMQTETSDSMPLQLVAVWACNHPNVLDFTVYGLIVGAKLTHCSLSLEVNRDKSMNQRNDCEM